MLPSCEIRCGDCREVLKLYPDRMAQCCVTSPPYWGLRDYGTATWEGGEAGCDHKQFNSYPTGLDGTDQAQRNGKFFKDVCQKCGARRIDSQLGLESTPDEYVATMVAVFREVWRVLRDDGTLWVNMGDSYASNAATAAGKTGFESLRGSDTPTINREYQGRIAYRGNGIKPKDLCGIPWRLAFAFQADGWYLRSDIIWHKPNPMPESVTDRPTKAHEYIFLMSKQERYFYDADAIREKGSDFLSGRETRNYTNPKQSNGDFGVRPGEISGSEIREFRNKRTVWTIATQPYAEAHFATFPEDLIKPCILAGSRLGDIVLDPFGGSGTTGKVALELGRRALLIELNPDYAALAKDRTNITPGFL